MVKPYYSEKSKKTQVRAMFNGIARNYDFLNHFLSGGIDIFWRKKLIKKLRTYQPTNILDIATGTGDLAIMAARNIKNTSIVGVDISEGMIEVGKKKIVQKKLEQQITCKIGDAENLNEVDETYDAAMVSFGVRNFENLSRGLIEIGRVLKKEKPLLVLEFSTPKNAIVKVFYFFYSFKLLPFIGKIVSKDSRAYSYLPESIREFPYGEKFVGIMKDCGYIDIEVITLSAGIATIYIGHKA